MAERAPQTAIHTSDGVYLWDMPPSTMAAPGRLLCGPADYITWNSAGSCLAAVLKEKLLIIGGDSMTVVAEIPEADVNHVKFSPNNTYLVSWRRKTSDEPNLKVWLVSTGELVAQFSSRNVVASTWPIQWTADEKFAFRLSNEGRISVFPGNLEAADAIARIPTENISAFWVGPGGPPYSVVTFVAKTKSKPGNVALWAFPNVAVPAGSKSMEADEARVEFSPDGRLALIEMRTASSASSYYGDSRLFLLSVDGKIGIAVPSPKEGPVHDFAWSPKGDNFVTVVGKSPPTATLYNKTGVATFSFGSGSFNTVMFQPQSRFLFLGGFGNMSGPIQTWDINKCKTISGPFLADSPTAVNWSACGRIIVTATTHPRLKVDNGVTLWSYKGVKVANFSHKCVYAVLPRVCPDFPDRAASPLKGEEKLAAPTAAPAKYVPPHLRGSGASSTVSAMMSAERKPAMKLSHAELPASGVVGDSRVLSEGEKKRAKAKAKKEAAEREEKLKLELEALAKANAGSGVEAVEAPPAEFDRDKEIKKVQKKLKQIQELQARSAAGEAMNDDQLRKLAEQGELSAKLDSLLTMS